MKTLYIIIIIALFFVALKSLNNPTQVKGYSKKEVSLLFSRMNNLNPTR